MYSLLRPIDVSHGAPQVPRDKHHKFVRGCAGVDVQVVSFQGFVCLSHALFFRTSLRYLCRWLLASSTSATKFVYFENGYDESSGGEAPWLALHAMYDTVHRALINRYTDTLICT
jgi:hypothetical protein